MIPIEHTIQQPRLIDKPIERARVLLKNNLQWLEFSLGRARVGTELNTDRAVVLFPEVQQGKKQSGAQTGQSTDWYKAWPNGNTVAQSYFQVVSDEIIAQHEAVFLEQHELIVSIVFFIDKYKIDLSYNSDLEQNLIWEITKIIKNKLRWDLISVDDEIEQVYGEYTTAQIKPEFTDHRQYAYLRFNCSTTYRSDCSLSAYPYSESINNANPENGFLTDNENFQ